MIVTELAGQRLSGRSMSERECFSEAVHHLAQASNCLRGLAVSRGDMRWLIPVRLLDEITDRIKRLMHRAGAPLLILPERSRH